jgi:CubicO group peptidase (beta-lactamase class C family)
MTLNSERQPYMVVTVIVERLSLQHFTSFVSSRIFRPLHMNGTTYIPEAAIATGVHAQSFSPDKRRIPNWFADDDYRICAGMTGVISSTVDMAKWVRLLLGKAGEEATGAIPASVLAECMKPQSAILDIAPAEMPLPTNGTVTYGFGWMQLQYHQHQVSPLCRLGSSYSPWLVAVGSSYWQHPGHQHIYCIVSR